MGAVTEKADTDGRHPKRSVPVKPFTAIAVVLFALTAVLQLLRFLLGGKLP